MFFRCAICVALALPALVFAADIPADPADPAVAVPSLRYEAAFAGYRSFQEQTLAPWREVNDEVKAGEPGVAMPPGPKEDGGKVTAPMVKPPASVTVRKPGAHQH